MRLNLFPLSLLLLSVSGCVLFGSSDVPERQEYWKNVVARVNTTKVTVEELLEEYAEFSVTNPDENGYLRIIERGVRASGFPCSHWDIGIKAAIDEDGDASNAELQMNGVCL